MASIFGGGDDPPDAPDPTALARAQAKVNRVDTYSPWGSGVYSGKDRSRLDISLSPEQQALLGGQQALQGGMLDRGLGLLGGLPTEALNFEGLPGYVGGLDMSGLPGLINGQDVAGAMYGRALGMLQPEFDTARRRTESMLNDRGLPITGEAWNREMDRLDRGQNDALGRLSMDATIGGESVARANRGMMFGEMGSNAALQNAARQQGIAERQALRANPYAELAAIMGQQGVQMPQFSPPTPVDVMGPAQMQYQGQLAGWQNQQANNQAAMGGLFGLGSAALGGWLGA